MLSRVPVAARRLGLAGLVPFFAPPLAILALPALTADPAAVAAYGVVLVGVQLTYAAVIVSFLGAVHWGLVLADRGGRGQGGAAGLAAAPARMAWSVVPSLGAWLTLVLFQVTLIGWLGLALMAAWLLACFVYDRWAIGRGLAPGWYLDLRKVLTAGALSSLALTIAAAAAVS